MNSLTKISFIVILSLGLFSCNSNQKNEKLQQNCKITDTLNTNEEVENNYFPDNEFIVEYKNPQDSLENVIQIFNSYNEAYRKVIAKYKIGKDILLNYGNIESILITEKVFDDYTPVLKIHFISSVGNKNAREYCDFCIPNDTLTKLPYELLSVFKAEYKDKQQGLRQFIVVISDVEHNYYNNIYEIKCSKQGNCKIEQLCLGKDFPVAKNFEEFNNVFPKYMSNKSKNGVSDKTTYEKPYNKAVLYYVDTLNKKSINKIFDGQNYYNGKVNFKTIDDFYTIGKEIKTKFYFRNLFFREFNGIPQICFTRIVPDWDYDYDKISYIEKYDFPEKTTIVSVFGYSYKRDINYPENFIVVISKADTGKYRTSLFRESCGNRYCSIEKVYFENQEKLFENVKKYEDFVKVFPKIMKENILRYYDD